LRRKYPKRLKPRRQSDSAFETNSRLPAQLKELYGDSLSLPSNKNKFIRSITFSIVYTRQQKLLSNPLWKFNYRLCLFKSHFYTKIDRYSNKIFDNIGLDFLQYRFQKHHWWLQLKNTLSLSYWIIWTR
jgi:hypothetical protein